MMHYAWLQPRYRRAARDARLRPLRQPTNGQYAIIIFRRPRYRPPMTSPRAADIDIRHVSR